MTDEVATNEMIDRVAAAIEEASAGCDPRDKKVFAAAARAALQAMREPTEVMLVANGGNKPEIGMHGVVTNPGFLNSEHAKRVWQAMIDEALK